MIAYPMNVLAGALATLVVAGCASVPSEYMASNTPSRECKAVAVYSASDAIRYQVHGGYPDQTGTANASGVPSDSIARSQGAAGLARAKIRPGARAVFGNEPGTGAANEALRNC